jgi:copper(I)-binding protein
MRRLSLIGASLLAACRPAAPTAPAIEIRDAWARETAPGQTSGVAYFTIVNSGSGGDKLVSVTTPAASMAMLHGSANANGVVSMRMMANLPVPGSATVTLAPLGTHVMLTGLSAPLHAGDRVPLTLRFARAGDRQVDAAVLPASASGPAR